MKRKRQGLQHKLRKVHVQAGRSLLEELIGKEEIWDSDDVSAPAAASMHASVMICAELPQPREHLAMPS